MKQIEILNIDKKESNGYISVMYIFRFPLPASLLNSGIPVNNAQAILRNYGYDIEVISGSPNVTVATYTQSDSPPNLTVTKAQVQTILVNRYNQQSTQLNSITLKPYDSLVGAFWDGTTWAV